VSRSFDLELSDASFTAERSFDRDREREPRHRRPRYAATSERSRQIEARFAGLLGASAVCPTCRRSHESMLADDATWFSLPLAGYWDEENDDGTPNQLLELRHFPCGTTLSRVVTERRSS
jgi:hypothetical protein